MRRILDNGSGYLFHAFAALRQTTRIRHRRTQAVSKAGPA
jgi:hypothetical protein